MFPFQSAMYQHKIWISVEQFSEFGIHSLYVCKCVYIYVCASACVCVDTGMCPCLHRQAKGNLGVVSQDRLSTLILEIESLMET